MSAATKSKISTTSYRLDPAKAGVSLDTPGNPTKGGWKVVIPAMWKFRFEVDDKAQTTEPDFYRDKEWYLDVTKADYLAEIYEENPDIHPADLNAESLCQYLDSQQITLRPNDHLLGGICSDTHGIHFDPLGYPRTTQVRCQEKAGNERVIAWEGDKKVVFSEKKFKRLEKFAQKLNTVFKVKGEFTEDEFNMYYCPQPGRYFEPVGSAGLRANPDHAWYLPLGLGRIKELKQKRMEQFELELNMDGTSAERKAELEDHIINSKGACRRDAQYPQVLKAVEFALFNGQDPDPEFSWVKSVETSNPSEVKDFEEFYAAWLKQWVVRTEVTFRNRVYEKLGQIMRRPFLSALYKGCLETGLGVMNYLMPRYSFQSIVGMVDTIDSLAAVNQLVFIDKKYTMVLLADK